MHMHRRSEKEQGNFNTLKKDVKIFLQPTLHSEIGCFRIISKILRV